MRRKGNPVERRPRTHRSETTTGRRLSPPTILAGPTILVDPTARGSANLVEVILVEVIAPIRTAIAESHRLLGKPMARYVQVAALPLRFAGQQRAAAAHPR